MTCVFDAVMREFKQELKRQGINSMPALQHHLRRMSMMTPDVRVNGQLLSEQQQKENAEAMKSITVSRNGYPQSTCDPLYTHLSQCYKVNITHEWNHNVTRTRKNVSVMTNYVVPNARRNVFFKSSVRHTH